MEENRILDYIEHKYVLNNRYPTMDDEEAIYKMKSLKGNYYDEIKHQKNIAFAKIYSCFIVAWQFVTF